MKIVATPFAPLRTLTLAADAALTGYHLWSGNTSDAALNVGSLIVGTRVQTIVKPIGGDGVAGAAGHLIGIGYERLAR